MDKILHLTWRHRLVILKIEEHRKSGEERFYDALLFITAMRRTKNKNNFSEIQEKVMNWIWVVLLISAIMFLRGLLSDMNTQTNKLSEERKKFHDELTEEREESKELYRDFYAELNNSIKKAMESIRQ